MMQGEIKNRLSPSEDIKLGLSLLFCSQGANYKGGGALMQACFTHCLSIITPDAVS